MDSNYETNVQRAIRPDGGPHEEPGYSYWADGKGWENKPGTGPTPTAPAPDATTVGGTSIGATMIGPSTAAGYGSKAEPTAVYQPGAPGVPGGYGGGPMGPGVPGGYGPGVPAGPAGPG